MLDATCDYEFTRLVAIADADDTETLKIEFRSPTRAEFLLMEPVSAQQGEAVSLRLRVDVHVQGFSAQEVIWVETAAVADFASALKSLEATRRGEAVLQGEDPRDLELKVSALDRVGHMLLEFKVARLDLVGDDGRPTLVQLTGGFELDPGLLPGLVGHFDQVSSLFTARS